MTWFVRLRGSAIWSRRWVVSGMGEGWNTWVTNCVFFYSISPLRPVGRSHTGFSSFLLSRKSVHATALFCEHWIWNRQMGPKMLKSQFTMRTVDVFVCDNRGREGKQFIYLVQIGYLYDIYLVHRTVVWFGRKTRRTPSLYYIWKAKSNVYTCLEYDQFWRLKIKEKTNW